MGPEVYYYAVMALVVLPSMFMNRMALLIGSVWTVGQLVHLAGLPSAPVDLTLDLLSLFGAMLIVRFCDENWANLIAGLLFAPMFAVHAAEMAGQIHPYHAWWTIFWLAMLQGVIVPWGNDWQFLRESWSAVRDMSWVDKLLRTVE